jgi:hypothetical protein
VDSHNRFETKATARLLRLEWVMGLVICVTLAIIHIGSINWPVFIGFFVVIDLIGYVPGAIAYRRSPNHVISKKYYLAYNTMHSLLTAGAMAGIWMLAVRPEWALLAIPIHLFGDRGLFGNSLKPFNVKFEPVTHPAFAEFERRFADRSGQPTGSPSDSPPGKVPVTASSRDHLTA